MRAASWIAAAVLCAASPALATGTIVCRSTVSPTLGPQLSLVIGRGAGAAIVGAHLAHEDEAFSTGAGEGAPVIAQAWLDRNMLKLDIAEPEGAGRIVRLDTRRRAGSDYLGILRYRGRTWRVRCDGGDYMP